jgi:hypothetical protein
MQFLEIRTAGAEYRVPINRSSQFARVKFATGRER